MKFQISISTACLLLAVGCQRQSQEPTSHSSPENIKQIEVTTQSIAANPTPIPFTNAGNMEAGTIEARIVAVSPHELRSYLTRKGEPWPALASEVDIVSPNGEKVELKADATQAFLNAKMDTPLEFPAKLKVTMILMSGETTTGSVELQAVGTGPDAVPMSQELIRTPTLERINLNLTLVSNDLRPDDFDGLVKATDQLETDLEQLSSGTIDGAPLVEELKKAASLARQGTDTKDISLTAQAQDLVRAQREKISILTAPSSKED